jgi:hypothetical protein
MSRNKSTRYEVRYRSHITGNDALYETYFDKEAAYVEAKAFRERCFKYDNPQTAGSVFVDEK